MRTISLALLAAISLAAPASAESPQVPTLHAVSLTRGAVISRSRVAASDGFSTYSNQSAETTRRASVRVQLRSFSKPRAPYEVQCFFTAKDAARQRYVYDVVRVLSDSVFDEIDIFGRDLFGGLKTVERHTSIDFVESTGGFGSSVDRVRTSVVLATAIPGAKLEGWIVRVISGGRVVRISASLQELKTLAERDAALLDEVAAQAKKPE